MSTVLAAFIGGALAGALISWFYEHRIRRLKRMVEANIKIMQSGHNLVVEGLAEAIAQRDETIGELRDLLERIDSWCEAYPLDIFPEPDLIQARRLLEAGGMTLDAVSASSMRLVLQGVRKIAQEGNR